MPRFQSSDIAHTAATDHRIPRGGGAGDEPAGTRGLRPGQGPLAYFFQDLVDPRSPEIRRDLGLAYMRVALSYRSATTQFCQMALPLLADAVSRWPDDVEAMKAKGSSLWLQGRLVEAQSVYEAVLALAPEHELALIDSAMLAMVMERNDASLGYFKRLMAVNPWQSEYHRNYAKLLAARREWAEAAAECRTTLRLNPTHRETRSLLITCLLRTGNKEQAQAEFNVLLGLAAPEERDSLRRWFAEQESSGG
jgi:Flp pilus assembly protein TadD